MWRFLCGFVVGAGVGWAAAEVTRPIQYPKQWTEAALSPLAVVAGWEWKR